MTEIELVIKIPEVLYEYCKNYDTLSTNICKAIANSTSLPKGHGRLIDADALIKRCMNGIDNEFIGIVNEIPTIIEADKESE